MRILAAISLMLILAGPAGAYRLLLDLDRDGDPHTFNTWTTEDSVTVSLVLSPDGGDEWIEFIEFGLGGYCNDGIDCGWSYGTGTSLFSGFGAWLDHPLFSASNSGGLLCAYCCGDPGFHHMYDATAAGGGFQLTENIFLCEFMAWAYEDNDPQCPIPDSNLMTFDAWGPLEPWCEILIAQEATAVPGLVPMPASWQVLKSLY